MICAPLAGDEIATTGPFLSTLMPADRPGRRAVRTLSQTERVPVAAAAVSVPAATVVVNENDASAGSASPDAASAAVHGMPTSAPLHAAGAPPHATVGASGSTLRTIEPSAPVLPTVSVATKQSVVVPAAVIGTVTWLPVTTLVSGIACAPEAT